MLWELISCRRTTFYSKIYIYIYIYIYFGDVRSPCRPRIPHGGVREAQCRGVGELFLLDQGDQVHEPKKSLSRCRIRCWVPTTFFFFFTFLRFDCCFCSVALADSSAFRAHLREAHADEALSGDRQEEEAFRRSRVNKMSAECAYPGCRAAVARRDLARHTQRVHR